MGKRVTDQTFAASILALAVLAISGCAIAGTFSPMQSFQVRDSVRIDPPRSDLLDVATDAGQALGMRVNVRSVDRVMLIQQSSFGETYFTGKHTAFQITALPARDGASLVFDTGVSGNYGTATKAAAEDFSAKYKAALAERLKAR
jgi:hypothetical protein